MQQHFGYKRQPLVAVLFVVLASSTMMAQTDRPSPQPSPLAKPQATATPEPPVANPIDVSSIDAIIGAIYDVHSGLEGKQRDRDRMRSLFVPGARLIPTGPRKTGGLIWRVSTVEEYISRAFSSLEKQGFFEKEVARHTEVWGDIAQVFSSYESRHKFDDLKPFQRGINSFQLVNDGTRWWIVSVLWQNENEKNRLPKKYSKK
jgi:hypothetical protein